MMYEIWDALRALALPAAVVFFLSACCAHIYDPKGCVDGSDATPCVVFDERDGGP